MVLVGGAGLVALLVLWTGWTAWSAAGDLEEVERSARLLRQEIEQGDADGAVRALDRYQAAAGDAQRRTSGPTWWTLEQLPLFGDDAEAIATAAEVLDDLGEEGIPQLVDAAELVAARSFNPSDNRFPLDTIKAVGEPARQSEQAFDDAAADWRPWTTAGWWVRSRPASPSCARSSSTPVRPSARPIARPS